MPPSWATPLRIQQIVDNLLSNALKFTAQGTVTVHVFVRVRYLVFSVSDTGRGIARNDLEQIFQAFTRLSSAQGVEGFGLGLTITRQLVDLMHGRLDVRSMEGAGSTFTVEIRSMRPMRSARQRRYSGFFRSSLLVARR